MDWEKVILVVGDYDPSFLLQSLRFSRVLKLCVCTDQTSLSVLSYFVSFHHRVGDKFLLIILRAVTA